VAPQWTASLLSRQPATRQPLFIRDVPHTSSLHVAEHPLKPLPVKAMLKLKVFHQVKRARRGPRYGYVPWLQAEPILHLRIESLGV
jgi:hypothetical protein